MVTIGDFPDGVADRRHSSRTGTAGRFCELFFLGPGRLTFFCLTTIDFMRPTNNEMDMPAAVQVQSLVCMAVARGN